VDQVEEVRNKIDIVELINEYVPLKKSGRNFRALCPFHSETKPSFFVSPELQIFKCFGCGKAGNIFNFLMEMEGMTFGEALRDLAKRAGVKLKAYKPGPEEKQREILFEINHLASEFYHYVLTQHPAGKKALQYAKTKRLISEKSIEKFKLGHAPDMWDGLIQFLVSKKGYRVEDLERAGLIIRGQRLGVRGQNYYDRFRNRLIFPLFDHRGDVRGFAGRIIDQRPTTNDQRPKYVNTPETAVYHKSNLLYGLEVTKGEIKKKNLAIIVEGEIDVLSSYQAGVRNVVAIKGSALTQEQVRLLSRFCENIAIAFDFDIAGDAAARRGIEIAEEAGLNIRVIRPLFGKDPDECVRQSASLWHQSVKKAVPIWDFYINSAFERHQGKTAEQKKKISQEVIPLIARISNEIVKAHYIKTLAKQLGVDEEVVIREMSRLEKRRRKTAIKAPATTDDTQTKPRWELLEEYLLALVLQNRAPFKTKIDIKAPVVKKIFDQLAKIKRFSIKSFHKKLPEELRETASRLYLKDLGEIDFKREIEKTLKELEKVSLRDRLKELASQKKFKEFDRLSKKIRQLEV
jgi:DNA primase